mmetsp:Transcript_19193/g.41710  ORF Transcript_19193/g.41710 Transcript_19193/m.41710 type:complete len:89 (+) Transcript_19193:368-634(+)
MGRGRTAYAGRAKNDTLRRQPHLFQRKEGEKDLQMDCIEEKEEEEKALREEKGPKQLPRGVQRQELLRTCGTTANAGASHDMSPGVHE